MPKDTQPIHPAGVTPADGQSLFDDVEIDARLDLGKIGLCEEILTAIHDSPQTRVEIESIYDGRFKLTALRSTPEWYAAERKTGLVAARPLRKIIDGRATYLYESTAMLLEGEITFAGVMTALNDTVTRVSRFAARAEQLADAEAGVAMAELLRYQVDDGKQAETLLRQMAGRLERAKSLADKLEAEAKAKADATATALVTADA
jgi:hypothetical protein